MGIIVTLYITLCSPTQCEAYTPASWYSEDFSALEECELVAEGMPEQLTARCVAALAK